MRTTIRRLLVAVLSVAILAATSAVAAPNRESTPSHSWEVQHYRDQWRMVKDQTPYSPGPWHGDGHHSTTYYARANRGLHRLIMRWVRYERAHPWSQARASYYDDAGNTASGYHVYYGVATCGDQVPVCYPMGTRIEFRYNGRSVTATVDDHGPYANGAAFDLNQATAAALPGVESSGVVDLQYRVVR